LAGIQLKEQPLTFMVNNEVKGDITCVLESVEQRGGASEELLPLVYQELRQLAASRMADELAGQTLQATALVHEAWLRLFEGPTRLWHNRAHFFGAAAQAMRRILIERARRKLSLKRGMRAEHVSIEDVDVAETLPDERVLLIDEALERLQEADAELARIVLLKFYAGLTNVEVAGMLEVTERTVQNKWTFARAWLLENIRQELKPAP
jgi:RNA polymerase sigma factor (TIGR02999 family)